MAWQVGGRDTWRDYKITRTEVIDLPRGEKSLITFLKSAYNIRAVSDPTTLYLENGQTHITD